MSKATSNKKPYFGLTGMALNAWVNVALYHGYDTFRYGRVRSFHAFVLKAISQDTTKVYMVES